MRLVSAYEVRRAIIEAHRFLEKLYKETSDGKYGIIPEYPTGAPFGQYILDIDRQHCTGMHALILENECVGRDFYAYWWLHPVGEPPFKWEWILNNTHDYMCIYYGGFEEYDEATDWESLEAKAGTWTCPAVRAEFCTNQLLLNPSVEFRKFLSDNIDEDMPWFWERFMLTGLEEARLGILKGPEEPCSHTGFLNLVLKPNHPDGSCMWYQKTSEPIIPGQSYAFGGHIKGNYGTGQVMFAVKWLDENDDVISTSYLPIPNDQHDDWRCFGSIVEAPEGSRSAIFVFSYSGAESSDYYVYGDTFFFVTYPVNKFKQLRFTIQPDMYDGNRSCDLYIGKEKVYSNINKDTIFDIRRQPPVIVKTDPWGMFPSNRFAPRHAQILGYYFYTYDSFHPDCEIRAKKLYNYCYDFSKIYPNVPFTTFPDFYAPMWNITNDWPDDWYWHHDGWDYWTIYEFHHWQYQPREVDIHPYRSKVLICRPAFMGDIAGSDTFAIGHKQHLISMSLIAMHYMNKYRDPDVEFQYWDLGTATPRGLITGDGPCPTTAPIIDYWRDPDEGGGGFIFPTEIAGIENKSYTATNQGACLAALSELGYGFGDSTAREYADKTAKLLVRIQWGYPFSDETADVDSNSFEGLGVVEVSRPDFRGGFKLIYESAGNWNFASGAYPFIVDYVADLIAGMKPETPTFLAVNQESFIPMRALEIYEWYAFRGNRGIFPSILSPADVNGDGRIDGNDLFLIKKFQGSYCLYADVNLDGVVDSKDYDIVKKRAKIEGGVIWLSKESEPVSVVVT